MSDRESRAGVNFYADRAILEWLARLHVPHDQGLAAAFDAPEKNGMPAIMVGPSEGKLLGFLLKLARAKRVVEVGTLAGYSTIHMARALPPGGQVYTIEFDDKHAAVARQAFDQAGVADRVELLEGAALDLLPKLAAAGPFDAVFIDADKGNYDKYGAWAAHNLCPGGLLLGDNAFYFKKLLDPDNAEAAAMRRFHEQAALAFDTVCLPTPDGLLLGIKRA